MGVIFALRNSAVKRDTMSQREKIEAILIGAFIGFLLSELIVEQNEQSARLRDLRKRLNANNGFDDDAKQLQNDWQNVRLDLKAASAKILNNVI